MIINIGMYIMLQKDVRQPSHSGFKWSAMSDVESLAWDPHSEHSFVVHNTLLFLLKDKSLVSRHFSINRFVASFLSQGKSRRWNRERLWYTYSTVRFRFWFKTKFHYPSTWTRQRSLLHLIQHFCTQCTFLSLSLSPCSIAYFCFCNQFSPFMECN